MISGLTHELTEAFHGGEISLNKKRAVGGASRFGKNSGCLKAYGGAIKQPGRRVNVYKKDLSILTVLLQQISKEP